MAKYHKCMLKAYEINRMTRLDTPNFKLYVSGSKGTDHPISYVVDRFKSISGWYWIFLLMDSPGGEQLLHFVHQQRFGVAAVSSQQLSKIMEATRNSSQGIHTTYFSVGGLNMFWSDDVYI